MSVVTLKKNQIIPLTIEDISSQGLGVGRYSGIVVFVGGTAPGDIISAKVVKVLKSHSFAIVETLVTPSPHRVENDCPIFPKCGGCRLRHISYARELELKASIVSENLARIGGITLELEEIIPSPKVNRYRNKAQYPVQLVDEEIKIGFYASRSHQLIPTTDCLLQPKVFATASAILIRFMTENHLSPYDEKNHSGLVRHLCLRSSEGEKELLVTLVINSAVFPNTTGLVSAFRAELPGLKSLTLSHNMAKTNVILGEKETILYGDGTINDTLAGVSLGLSSRSFYQVNREATQHLYAKVAEYAQPTDSETLLDLYCGIGAIGFSLAGRLKQLIGVEISPRAIKDATINAGRNGISNASFICADSGKAASRLAKDGVCPDIVIVDPPRKGIDQLTVDSIAAMGPKRIVYVSCNSATLARDLRLLENHGYRTTKGVPVDLFPRTMHVECVVLMEKTH